MTKQTAATPIEAHVRRGTPADLPRLREILNDEILTSTASWTTVPKTIDDMAAWLSGRMAGGFPVLVAEMPAGGPVAGYGSYGPFRPGQGYAGTVEHSVYVDAAHRRAGVAACLIGALVEHARHAGKRLMIGGVSGEAEASLRFHRRMGFTEVGRVPGAGHKFGRSLDLVFMARRLQGPRAGRPLH